MPDESYRQPVSSTRSHLSQPERTSCFLNSCAEKMEESLCRVKVLDPRFVIPNHYSGLDGEMHRRKLDVLMGRKLR